MKSELPCAPDLCQASVTFQVSKFDYTVAQVQSAVLMYSAQWMA